MAMINMTIKIPMNPNQIIVGVKLPMVLPFIKDKPNAIKSTKNFLKNLKALKAKIMIMPFEDCRIGCEKSVTSINIGTNDFLYFFSFKMWQPFNT
ncbi:hypothetical protein GCM10008085_12970 [Winogradskyella epiphytica]|nr:hypothetical protein GCM10008085_12970 [Winogradskyella epiphytica]